MSLLLHYPPSGRVGSDEEEDEPPVKKTSAVGGVAIAPRLSLQ
jgi:hypothetical protein